MKASANEESKGAPVFYVCSRTEYNHDDWSLVDDLSSTSASPSVPTSLSSSEIAGESAPLTPGSPESEKEAAPVDHFKASSPPSANHAPHIPTLANPSTRT